MLENENPDEFDCKPIDISALVGRYKNMPAMACLAAKCSFFVDWEGHMSPCPLFSELFEEPLKIGYLEAWEGIRKKVEGIPLAEKCRSCDLRAFCPVCPPRLFLETGRYDGIQSTFAPSLRKIGIC